MPETTLHISLPNLPALPQMAPLNFRILEEAMRRITSQPILSQLDFLQRLSESPPILFSIPIQVRTPNQSADAIPRKLLDQAKKFLLAKDCICPISLEQLNPRMCTTLDSGHTFSSSEIKEWFDSGHNSCPISKSTVEVYYISDEIESFLLEQTLPQSKLPKHRF